MHDGDDSVAGDGRGAGATELRPRPRYAPQPYQQLATVYCAIGDTAAANAALYAARERERTEAWEKFFKVSKAKAGLSWLGLLLLKSTIGYGLAGRNFRALVRSVCSRSLAPGSYGPAGRTRSVLPLASSDPFARTLERRTSTARRVPLSKSMRCPIPRWLLPRPDPGKREGSVGAYGPASTGCCRSSNSMRRTPRPLPSLRADRSTGSTCKRSSATFWRASSAPVSPA
jgi:hypothetical protein